MKSFKNFLLALNLLIICLFATMAHGTLSGVAFTELGGFNTNNGANPYATPVFGPDGNLYGTTPSGGTNGVGVIYRISLNAQQATLHTFNSNLDGAYPVAGLTVGNDGNLYGVANAGGGNNQGTIFKVTTNGLFTTLYSFGMVTNDQGDALDGASPYGGLVLGRDGNFYGVTSYGGITNEGTVFQFSTNGTLTTLHSFTGDGTDDDGAYPYTAPLVEGANGIFYGTTEIGGTNDDGIIFQITANGTFTTLFEFDGNNGSVPYSGLSFGTDGNLYGTTSETGTNGYGSVFQITTDGILNTLFKFDGTNGFYPYGGVTIGLNNDLYGTTAYGGSKDYGIIFQITTNGQLTTLYSFTGKNDGANPNSGVIRAANGDLYGTATYGGNKGGYGTIYRLRDTTKPTLSITSPTSNQKWSNSVFSVTGKASDNVGVANVFYSLNNSGWINPITTNNWSNWTAQVTLTPGTNIIQSYALDDGGSLSATDTVKFVYILSAPLAVGVNGSGTVSPSYNGELLQVGANYSITAKAATGFGFTGWTGSATTNNATLKFQMASNLTFTANFVDTAKPTLAITSPKASQKWSNDVFSVTGTAKDNVGVSGVFYSLNNSGWASAATGNNWANWTAGISLTPGTNILSAYSVDAVGNLSATDTVKFVYILSAPLIVSTNGHGTISPNYNGELLQVGANYSMTAKPATGFGFVNWTDTNQNVLTNKTALKFLMASNLAFVANFVDITKPTLSITTPTANQKWSNIVFNVTGTAKDNVGVANVFYSLNNSGWANAATGNNWTNWTASLSLASGTNILEAYSIDAAGNTSTTDTVKFVYVTVDWAPNSLNGIVTTITPDGGTPFQLGFWTNTFSENSADTNNSIGVGSYTYAKLSTNTARLAITYTAPPLVAGGSNVVYLTFISADECAFSNEVNGVVDLGTASVAVSPNLVPSSLNGKKTLLVDTAGSSISIMFGSTTLTVTNSDNSVDTDTYTYKSYSPVGAQVIARHSGGTNYVEISFNATNYGDFFNAEYDSSGLLDTDAGVFAFRSQAAKGNAPASMAGTNALVTQQNGSFLLSLDAITFTQTASSTNDNTGVGTYNYTKLGTNTAQLDISYTAPLTLSNGTGSVSLTFIAPNFAIFTNQTDGGSNYLATFSLSAATNLIPAVLANHTVTATSADGVVDVITFNSDGTTFTQVETGSLNPGTSAGSYTFTPYSSIGGILQLNYNDGVRNGGTAYIQTTFTAASHGTFFTTFYDSLNNLSQNQGTFQWQ
jgi:uncharacterized repeat protein (TIGR02543 family)